MAATTTYDVRLRYWMQDQASRGLKTLNNRIEQTSRSTGTLSRGIAAAGAAITAAFGVHTAKKYLIDYNRQIEDATTTMAGLIDFTTKAGMEKSFAVSAKLVKDLEIAAKTSTATTADMVGFARETVQPLVQAGLATDKLANFTARAVVAAKAFGDEQIAAFDIQQALTKGVSIRDRFMMKLLNAAKMTNEEFNKMSTVGRLAFIENALNDPSIKALAERQANTFSGVFSTFQDNLEIAGGKIGSALFAKLTATLQRWNQWIDANGAKIEKWGKSLGDSLVGAFEVLERVGKFFVDNSATLLTLAKVFAASKIAGGITGALGGLGGTALRGGTLLKQMGGAALAKGFADTGLKLAKFGAGISTAAGLLGGLAGPIGLAATALIGIWSWWSDKKEEEEKTTANIDAAVGKMEALLDKQAYIEKKMSGNVLQDPLGFGKDHWRSEMEKIVQRDQAAAHFDVAKFAQEYDLLRGGKGDYHVGNFTPALADKLGFTHENYMKLTTIFNAFNRQLEDNTEAQLALHRLLNPEEAPSIQTENEKDNIGNGPTNVTINRIEVESNDPDRFVFGLTEAIRDYRKNPSQSAFTGFEGG